MASSQRDLPQEEPGVEHALFPLARLRGPPCVHRDRRLWAMAHVEFDEATLTTAEERASIHEESQCRKYLVNSPGPAYRGSRGFPKSLATWRTLTGAHRVIRGAEQSQRRASQWSASPRFAMAPGDFVKRVLLAHSWLWEQMPVRLRKARELYNDKCNYHVSKLVGLMFPPPPRGLPGAWRQCAYHLGAIR